MYIGGKDHADHLRILHAWRSKKSISLTKIFRKERREAQKGDENKEPSPSKESGKGGMDRGE